jgi:hypothetical protein
LWSFFRNVSVAFIKAIAAETFWPSPFLNRKNMELETESGVLDIHFGNKTDVYICRICLVEKNTSDHCKKNSLVISNGLLAWVWQAVWVPYLRQQWRPSWVYHLCNLWVKKRPSRLHANCTAPSILKNQIRGRIIVFSYQSHWWYVWQKNCCQVIIRIIRN